MRDAFHAVLRALAFLTRLPAPAAAFAAARPLGRDAWAFPLAGLVAALPSAALLAAAGRLGLSAATAAIMAVGLIVLVTGALHEDGLADVADGLGGHHSKARALEIMKDSRIGVYGALALALSLALRISLVADLLAAGAGTAALAFALAAAASRGGMAWLWSSLPPAVPGGVADRAGRPSPRTGRIAAGLGAATLAVPALLAQGVAAAALALAFGLAALAFFRRFLRRRIGGQTGDCLGAAQQITEIAILLGFAIAIRGG